MDVLVFIKENHQALRARCSDLQAEAGIKARRALMESLSKDLELHLRLEQEYLYPELSGLFSGADVLTATGLANGAAIRRRLKAMVKLVAQPAAEQSTYPAKLQELLDSVAAHFDLEEQTLMPKIRDAMRTEDREDLGEVLVETKADLALNDEPKPVVAAQQTKTRKRA